MRYLNWWWFDYKFTAKSEGEDFWKSVGIWWRHVQEYADTFLTGSDQDSTAHFCAALRTSYVKTNRLKYSYNRLKRR